LGRFGFAWPVSVLGRVGEPCPTLDSASPLAAIAIRAAACAPLRRAHLAFAARGLQWTALPLVQCFRPASVSGNRRRCPRPCGQPRRGCEQEHESTAWLTRAGPLAARFATPSGPDAAHQFVTTTHHRASIQSPVAHAAPPYGYELCPCWIGVAPGQLDLGFSARSPRPSRFLYAFRSLASRNVASSRMNRRNARCLCEGIAAIPSRPRVTLDPARVFARGMRTASAAAACLRQKSPATPQCAGDSCPP